MVSVAGISVVIESMKFFLWGMVRSLDLIFPQGLNNWFWWICWCFKACVVDSSRSLGVVKHM